MVRTPSYRERNFQALPYFKNKIVWKAHNAPEVKLLALQIIPV